MSRNGPGALRAWAESHPDETSCPLDLAGRFSVAIFDEAHTIKNCSAQISQTCLNLRPGSVRPGAGPSDRRQHNDGIWFRVNVMSPPTSKKRKGGPSVTIPPTKRNDGGRRLKIDRKPWGEVVSAHNTIALMDGHWAADLDDHPYFLGETIAAEKAKKLIQPTFASLRFPALEIVGIDTESVSHGRAGRMLSGPGGMWWPLVVPAAAGQEAASHDGNMARTSGHHQDNQNSEPMTLSHQNKLMADMDPAYD
ncbi:hypothetical protein EMPG_16589 [Blastomyces silverae]|uniref:Uncharacterized protein n=1 Tax=Blastomyces silverae TaxID=2060906 RepID=A0A0H1BA91_9EURO|nr:hypothetical protein EMPG_16589 [Blastomyces silverae]